MRDLFYTAKKIELKILISSELCSGFLTPFAFLEPTFILLSYCYQYRKYLKMCRYLILIRISWRWKNRTDLQPHCWPHCQLCFAAGWLEASPPPKSAGHRTFRTIWSSEGAATDISWDLLFVAEFLSSLYKRKREKRTIIYKQRYIINKLNNYKRKFIP